MTILTHLGPVLTRAELSTRGWTRSMVIALLDPPDQRKPNPFYRSSTPMYLYRLERVEQAEAGPEFARLSRRARLRSAQAKATAQRRRDALLAEVRSGSITLPSMTRAELAEAAVRHRNKREEQRCYLVPDRHFEPATVDDIDPVTLARWQVDYLRRRQTGYDQLMSAVTGRVGRADATRAIRAKLYNAIATAYPSLRRECDRQLRLPEIPDHASRAH